MSKALKAYSDEFVMSRIHVIRGQKVMLDGEHAWERAQIVPFTRHG
ncbi:MAG: hypothetical protein KIT10_09675 [Flavobacteriales bacterium]|nr:hypothetical protein [Flavobacteriales bacterium]